MSWLFGGTIEHRDSVGTHALVRPGELNLMTAGSGISHSEVSTDEATVLHGVQLWVALPAAHRHTGPAFTHYVPPVVHGQGWDAQVFLGSMFGHTSPVRPSARCSAPRSSSTAAPRSPPPPTRRSSTACWSTSAPST